MKNKTISLVIDSLREKYGDMAGEYYVGFSGGIDSTALLLMLVAAGIPVTAVHFEHGLRGDESKADCAWCEEFCRARSIRFLSRSLEVLGNRREGEGIEEAARRLRLEAWQSLVANGTVVFLGHHADDVLEDLFLRLARGSNSSGLTGLREYRELNGLMIHRPLLDLRKDDLEKWLLEQGVADWRIDRTNAESEYRRNAVRNELLPLARRIFEGDGGFRRSLEVLRADADYLERLALVELCRFTLS
jgi:tRNA(Ile)-lysidine synthase